MDWILNIVTAISATGVGVYCFVLSKRLSDFQKLDGDLGKAVSDMSAQVEKLNLAAHSAHLSADQSANNLSEAITQAEDAAKKLELLISALHDLPHTPSKTPATFQRHTSTTSKERA